MISQGSQYATSQFYIFDKNIIWTVSPPLLLMLDPTIHPGVGPIGPVDWRLVLW